MNGTLSVVPLIQVSVPFNHNFSERLFSEHNDMLLASYIYCDSFCFAFVKENLLGSPKLRSLRTNLKDYLSCEEVTANPVENLSEGEPVKLSANPSSITALFHFLCGKFEYGNQCVDDLALLSCIQNQNN